jgi:hypothetical protein
MGEFRSELFVKVYPCPRLLASIAINETENSLWHDHSPNKKLTSAVIK